MTNSFIERLRGHGPLSEDEVSLLSDSCSNVRELPAGHHLIREGDEPDPVFVMVEGWAMGYKILPDGGRQIVSFMLPGDFCDIHISMPGASSALTNRFQTPQNSPYSPPKA